MRYNLRSGIAALAVIISTIGMSFPGSAQPADSKSKTISFVFPIFQIVGVDVDARTVKVLTPKIIEGKFEDGAKKTVAIDAASNQGEIITVALSSKVAIKQMNDYPNCLCSTPSDLAEMAAAFKKNQHISVSIDKNANGVLEVQQLVIFPAQSQKLIVQSLKEHFGIKRVIGSDSSAAK